MCANRTGLGQNYLRDMLRYHRLLVCERKLHYCYRLDPPCATNASDMGLAAKGDTESCSFDGVCYGGLGYNIQYHPDDHASCFSYKQ
jgi:hypothetical protein